MYFYPDGRVLTCCVNVDHVIGRVGEGVSIREMWEGERLRALRQALADDDFSIGCQRCHPDVVPGGTSFSHARQFDRLVTPDPPRFPRRMDFVLSNRCNLQCQMCNGELSSSIRIHREHRPALPKVYDDAFFDQLVEFIPHLEEIFFLGGEPFLAPEAWRVWDLMITAGVTVPVYVVTNGTQWNDRVERYLRSLDMRLSVSIDGATDNTTAALRVGADRQQIMQNIERYRAIIEPRRGNVVLNYCMMRQNHAELRPFLAEADALGLEGRTVTVTDPHEFSLYALDDTALAEVIAGLEAQARSGPRLGRNQSVWDDEVERLRQHLADRTKNTTSTVGGAAVAVETPVIRHGVIREVTAPPWAVELLDSDAWQGLRAEDLMSRITDRLGVLEPVAEDGARDGLLEYVTRERQPPLAVRAELVERGPSHLSVRVGVGPQLSI